MSVSDEKEIRIRSQLFDSFLESSADGIVILDAAEQIRFHNVSATRLLGLPQEGLTGTWASDSAKLLGKPDWECLNRHVQKIDVDGECWSLIRISKRESKLDAVELVAQARTDHLSGLLNRRGFQQSLESSSERRLALAIIDVDYFKKINDEHGHETGDLAIQWVADQLRLEFADAICIGRLGGDEFGVVLDVTSANLENRFARFCENVGQSKIDWYSGGIALSIGVAISSAESVAARTLLTQADRAMYRAKSAGRNRSITVVVD